MVNTGNKSVVDLQRFCNLSQEIQEAWKWLLTMLTIIMSKKEQECIPLLFSQPPAAFSPDNSWTRCGLCIFSMDFSSVNLCLPLREWVCMALWWNTYLFVVSINGCWLVSSACLCSANNKDDGITRQYFSMRWFALMVRAIFHWIKTSSPWGSCLTNSDIFFPPKKRRKKAASDWSIFLSREHRGIVHMTSHQLRNAPGLHPHELVK